MAQSAHNPQSINGTTGTGSAVLQDTPIINTPRFTGVDGLSGSLFGQSLINSSFDIWQRNTTFTYNDDTYGPDHWNLLTETNGAWTCARDTDVPAGGFAKYSAKLSNVTANNQCAIVQFIENVDAI